MRDKKRRISLIAGSYILLFGFAISGAVLAGDQKSSASASSNKEKTELPASEFNLKDYSSYSSEEEKGADYVNFLEETLASAVKDIAGISDCVINITESNSRWSEADVCITVNNSFDDASEAGIQSYVAQALDISAENVKISYK